MNIFTGRQEQRAKLAEFSLEELLSTTAAITTAAVGSGRDATRTSAFHFNTLMQWFMDHGITTEQEMRDAMNEAVARAEGQH
jgi:hypothetical protein